MFCGFFLKVSFFKGFFFCPRFFFFQEGSFFPPKGPFFTTCFQRFFFQWSIFSFFSPGLGFIFFEKVLFFFYRRGLNFCKGFFSKKKESVAFSTRLVCFLSKGFFSKETGFHFFEGMWFSSFFQMVLFLLFLQNTRTFFFKTVEIFLLTKKSFLQCFFLMERNVCCFFFFLKKGGCFFLQSVSFFEVFCFAKNKSFSLFTRWFFFQQTGFL